MSKDFYEAIRERRSYYEISKEQLVPDKEIEEIIQYVVKHTPSAFNSQTARVILLLDDHHTRLWDITKEALRKVVPEDEFGPTDEKINSFSAGRGTVLFFEDLDLVKDLQDNFPLYKDNFPAWSVEASGMHQFNVWTALRLKGYGASLQHYTELIEEDVRKEWDIPANWKMRAQMPFGKPLAHPGDKEFEPIEDRVIVYK